MNPWQNHLSNELIASVEGDDFWEDYLKRILSDQLSAVGIHLAIFVEPYLSYVLNGKKTIESRFGIRRHAPYGHVASGDIILLKKSGGPIVGLCKVSDVWFYRLDKESWNKLRQDFTIALCAQDPEFWKQRESASFATLMQIGSVREIRPFLIQKTDRRGWVVLRSSLVSYANL